MAMEIEWVFALTRLPGPPPASRGVKIVQAYLVKGSPSVRVRLMGERGYLTIKAEVPLPSASPTASASPSPPPASAPPAPSMPGPCIREEFEYEIPPADARRLIELAPWRLEKRRYHLDGGWTLDIFEGRHAGLVLAEFEMPEPGPAPPPPPGWEWIDVSQNRRYSNQRLAIEGLPDGCPFAKFASPSI